MFFQSRLVRVLAFVLSVAYAASPSRLAADPALDYIVGLAHSAGSVRLLITLRTPGPVLPEALLGPRFHTQMIANQRAMIQTTEEQFRQMFLSPYGITPIANLTTVPVVVATVSLTALQAILAGEGKGGSVYTALELDRSLVPSLDDSIPFIGGSATVPGFGSGPRWTGSQRSIAIIDSGVQYSHDFFALLPSGSRVLREQGACFGFNSSAGPFVSDCPGTAAVVYGSQDPTAAEPCTFFDSPGFPPIPDRKCQHGTHVAGIAAGRMQSLVPPPFGVAPDANIIPIKVVSRHGVAELTFQLASVLQAMDFLQTNRPPNLAAINLSLNDPASDQQLTCSGSACPTIEALVEMHRAAGTVTVVASGNATEGTCGGLGCPDALRFPAGVANVIAVGASGRSGGTDVDVFWSGSYRAPGRLTLVAPGENIFSSVSPRSDEIGTSLFAAIPGTSQATAHVSGAYAVLAQASPPDPNQPAAWIGKATSALTATAYSVFDFDPPPTYQLRDVYKRISLSEAADVVANVKSPTSITVSSASSPATAGVPVTLTAAVSGAATAGTVAFRSGAALLNTAAVNSSGTATASATFSTQGRYYVTAEYSGTATHARSTSSVLVLAVTPTKLPVSLSLTSSLNPSTQGQSVTFTLTVTSSQGTPTGTVTFTNNGAALADGTVNLGQGTATYTTSSLLNPPLEHQILASYSGDEQFASDTKSLTQQVFRLDAKPTQLTLSAQPTNVLLSQSSTLTTLLLLSPPQVGSITKGQMVLADNGVPFLSADVTPANLGVFEVPRTFPSIGLHTLTANYSDSTGEFASSTSTTTVTVQEGADPCSGPLTLCIPSGGRFHVSVTWINQYNGNQAGVGTVGGPVTTSAGYFWFFSPNNVELIAKVLDGRALNGHWWIFFGGLTDLDFTVTVHDSSTGAQRSYHNPPGTVGSYIDMGFFSETETRTLSTPPTPLTDLGPSATVFGTPDGRFGMEALRGMRMPLERKDGPLASTSCDATGHTLCFQADRFRAGVTWRNQYAGGATGAGSAVVLTSDAGYFWFFDGSNAELGLKVLDGRAVNGHYWVVYGSLTDVEYTLTVTDVSTQPSTVKTYQNAPYAVSGGIDITAFQ